MEVTVEYLDEGFGSFELDYDSTDPRMYSDYQASSGAGDVWKAAPVVDLTDTGQWKTHTFYLEDMRLGNRCNGADFRLGVYGFILNQGSAEDVVFQSVAVRRCEYQNPVETVISSPNLGNIFGIHEPITLSLETRNKTEQSVEMTWSYAVYEQDGQLLAQGTTHTDTWAGGEKKSFPLGIENPNRYGIYRVELTCEARDRANPGQVYRETFSREFSVSVLLEPGEGNPRFGVITSTLYNQWDTTENAAALLKKLGATATRTTVTWMRVESAPGKLDVPDLVTESATRFQQQGIDFIPICTIGRGSTSFYAEGGNVPTTEEGIAAFGRYCGQVARELAPCGVRYYEIWNEFDLDSFSPGIPDVREKAVVYTKLLAAAYDAIKAVDEDLVVLGLNAYNLKTANRWWMKLCLEEGAYEKLDMISVHPYEGTDDGQWDDGGFDARNYLEKMSKTRELLSGYKPEDEPLKPIWITEVGYSTYRGGHTLNSQANAMVLLNALTQAYDLADRVIQYDFYDRSYLGERENNWGLLYSWMDNLGNTPRGAKPSYLAMAAYNHFCGKYTSFKDKIADGVNYALHFYHQKLRKDVLLLIAGQGNSARKTFSLGCPAVEVYDRYGNLLRTETHENGIYTFDIGEEPIYLLGNFSEFSEADS